MSGDSFGGISPGVSALLQFAALMNGKCERCKRILPHPSLNEEHICSDLKDSSLDMDGYPKRWSDPKYLGDGPYGP